MRWWQGTVAIVRSVAQGYSDDRVPRLAAALSYYTVFSIAPLLVIAIAIAGVVFGNEAARGGIHDQIAGLVGDTGAQAIEGMIAGAARHHTGWASLLGVATLLFGATGVFGELQASLNTLWRVTAKPGHSLWMFLRTRFLSFAMVLSIGFLMLVSLALSALVGAVGIWLSHRWPTLSHLVTFSNIAVLWVVATALFAMIFKILPDVRLQWSDVWIGAAVTAALFDLGRWAIGLYLGHSAVASTYGAAGSLAVVLIWIYFSAQVFLIGAEFTKAFAQTCGSQVAPKEVAQWAASPAAAGAMPGAAPAAAPPRRPSTRGHLHPS